MSPAPLSGEKRANGSGNIRQRKSGLWDARLRDAQGKQRYLGSYDTEEDAEQALRMYKDQPMLAFGRPITIVRQEINEDGVIVYGMRDSKGTMWRMVFEPWI